IGAVIMTHSDDAGLVLPPRVAPVQVVIVPVYKEKERDVVMSAANDLFKALKPHFRVKLDDRENLRPGAKYFEWERKGVPLRLEIGPRDVAKGEAFSAKRTGGKKFGIAFDGVADTVGRVLDEIQAELLVRAVAFRDERTYTASSREEFAKLVETQPGFYKIPWGGDEHDEDAIKDE